MCNRKGVIGIGQKKLYLNLLPPFFYMLIIIMIYSCSTVSVQLNSKPIIINNVPFYPQEAFQCGPASLAGVMNYWGIMISPEDIAKAIYSESARGTLTIDMLIFANKNGLYAQQYEGGIDDIKEKIDRGYPLLVLVDLGFYLYKAYHYMVIIGYNNEGIIVNSGRNEKLFIDKERFLNMWKKTNYWTLWLKPYDSAI